MNHSTLATQIEDSIRADILTGVLIPGERLRAPSLSQRYGVSPTPLREALQRLQAQRLVTLGPRLGATVAQISKADFHDVYRLRQILECLALEQSIANGSEEWERDLTEAYQAFEQGIAGTAPPSESDILTWSALHRTFHGALFQACPSAWLLRFVGVLSDHSERYRMLSRRRAVRHPLKEHQDIYRATVERNTEAAQAALRHHLEATVEVLDAALAPLWDRTSPGQG